jgi:hypothetical protein
MIPNVPGRFLLAFAPEGRVIGVFEWLFENATIVAVIAAGILAITFLSCLVGTFLLRCFPRSSRPNPYGDYFSGP